MSITEKLNKIKSCKEDIKQAIIDKGVDMTGVSLEGYATKISEIQAGGGSGDYLEIRANLSTYYSTAEKVGYGDFAYCSYLQSINLPMCRFVSNCAFQSCSSLQSVNLPNCSSVAGRAFQYCESLQSINLPMCSYVGGSAFESCSSLTSINLPMCSFVGMYAFSYCTSLQTIDLPMCGYVEMNTFYRCSSLTSINIPMCSSVANYAFQSCSSLTSINIPMCSSVGGSAFQYCKSLSVLDIRSTYSCSLLNSRAFSSTPFASGIGSIYVHAAHLSQFQTATNWTYFSKCFVGVGDPTRPLLAFDSGRVYGDTYRLYSNWKSYLSITSNSVISIDLPNCSSVIIKTFASCSSLQSVNLPNCSSVGGSAFQGCTSLQTIDLPMCEYVDDYAFESCSSLTSINLPMCSHIGLRAVYDREGLTLYIGSYISTVCNLKGGFGYIMPGPSKSIFVPMSLVDAYKSAPYWSNYSRYIFGI